MTLVINHRFVRELHSEKKNPTRRHRIVEGAGWEVQRVNSNKSVGHRSSRRLFSELNRIIVVPCRGQI